MIATTTESGDDPIEQLSADLGYPVYRGSRDDVLERFVEASAGHRGPLVRITADCPLIDAAIVDDVVRLYERSDCAYASTINPRTFPVGLDTEVFSPEALRATHAETQDPNDREHVTEAIIRQLRTIRSEGHLVVVSTHDARLVPIADRIVQMVPDLDDVLRARTTRTLAAGESLFEQGDASDVVYIIVEGEIDIVRILADKSEQPLARLGPGQYCGELGPVMGFPRSASARAATDVVLTVLSPHEFRERMLHR